MKLSVTRLCDRKDRGSGRRHPALKGKCPSHPRYRQVPCPGRCRRESAGRRLRSVSTARVRQARLGQRRSRPLNRYSQALDHPAASGRTQKIVGAPRDQNGALLQPMSTGSWKRRLIPDLAAECLRRRPASRVLGSDVWLPATDSAPAPCRRGRRGLHCDMLMMS